MMPDRHLLTLVVINSAMMPDRHLLTLVVSTSVVMSDIHLVTMVDPTRVMMPDRHLLTLVDITSVVMSCLPDTYWHDDAFQTPVKCQHIQCLTTKCEETGNGLLIYVSGGVPHDLHSVCLIRDICR